jgi:hypothetical protein
VEIQIAAVQLASFSHRFLTASQPMVLYDSGGSQHVVKFAEKAEYGTLGLAHESLGGGLAELIGASVPTTTYVQLTTGALAMDPNIAFDDGTRPAPQVTVGSMYLENAASPVTPEAFTLISAQDLAGILVFNTWVSVGDRHWGNYLTQTSTNGPRLFSIDYTSCLSSIAPAPTSIRDTDLVAMARSITEAVEEFLRRLEAVSERSIQGIIGRVPRDWMDGRERNRVAEFLLAGRATTRALVTAALSY